MAQDLTRIVDDLDRVRARLNLKIAEENLDVSYAQVCHWDTAYQHILDALYYLGIGSEKNT